MLEYHKSKTRSLHKSSRLTPTSSPQPPCMDRRAFDTTANPKRLPRMLCAHSKGKACEPKLRPAGASRIMGIKGGINHLLTQAQHCRTCWGWSKGRLSSEREEMGPLLGCSHLDMMESCRSVGLMPLLKGAPDMISTTGLHCRILIILVM
jgi:hypothetical protein